MNDLLRFQSDEGGIVLVEIAGTDSSLVTRGGMSNAASVVEAGRRLEDVLGQVGPTIKGVVSELRAGTDWPDEVEIEFAIKISADSNVIIARAGGEANFRVSLKWTTKRHD